MRVVVEAVNHLSEHVFVYSALMVSGLVQIGPLQGSLFAAGAVGVAGSAGDGAGESAVGIAAAPPVDRIDLDCSRWVEIWRPWLVGGIPLRLLAATPSCSTAAGCCSAGNRRHYSSPCCRPAPTWIGYWRRLNSTSGI